MDLYVVRRRKAWATPEDLRASAKRSHQVDAEMSSAVRWIRSYVVTEDDGAYGMTCIYQAISPHALREHAARSGMPADEITPVADIVPVRSEPALAAA